MVGVGCWCGWVILLFLFVLPFLSSLVLCVFACRFLFWDKKQKEQRCDCSVRRSVGGIQLAAQRCFCRQRSYQRDHARSRLALIAEAKPVWARSVLPWVTRWESRVMLLSFFFLLQQLSLFSLFSFVCLLPHITSLAALQTTKQHTPHVLSSLPLSLPSMSVCIGLAGCTHPFFSHTNTAQDAEKKEEGQGRALHSQVPWTARSVPLLDAS